MIAYFLFYNEANGPQAWMGFSKEFSHCNIITFDGAHWVNFEMDKFGIHSRVLDVSSARGLIRGLKTIKGLTAMVCVEVGEPKAIRWKPWWVRSCNELGRYLSSVDVGFTFNPRHLYHKLLKYNGRRNYEILYAWRRSDGTIRWGRPQSASQ